MLKNILPIFLLSFSTYSLAQTSPSGQRTVFFDVKANVPSMCNISNAYFSNTNIGTYSNKEVKNYQYFKFNCKTNSNLEMSVSLGSNPHSTSSIRRMPLNGEQGEAEHYLEYYIEDSSKKKIGGTDLAIGIDYYGRKDITLTYVIPVQSKPVIVGDYFDNLEILVEYW